MHVARSTWLTLLQLSNTCLMYVLMHDRNMNVSCTFNMEESLHAPALVLHRTDMVFPAQVVSLSSPCAASSTGTKCSSA